MCRGGANEGAARATFFRSVVSSESAWVTKRTSRDDTYRSSCAMPAFRSVHTRRADFGAPSQAAGASGGGRGWRAPFWNAVAGSTGGASASFSAAAAAGAGAFSSGIAVSLATGALALGRRAPRR